MDYFSIDAALGYYQLKINYSKTKDMDIDKWITSPKFRVGQHDWTIKWYPKGNKTNKYVSVYLELCRASVDVNATFGFVLLDKNGSALETTLRQSLHTFTSHEVDWGFTSFIRRTKLEEMYIKDGCFELLVSICVRDTSCNVPFPCNQFRWLLKNPPTVDNASSSSSLSFPRNRIRKFRDENKQTDVTFDVNGKKFVAHRVILAAHSLVFEAELLGSMAESNLNCITIKEMIPSVFKAMLDFMYNGSLSISEELMDGDEPMSAISFLKDLLVAADRYAVEPLKQMCEHKLAGSISLDTVVSLLELTERHNCMELKKSCLQFVFDKEKSFSLMFDEGYFSLMQNYPSLLAELKEIAAK